MTLTSLETVFVSTAGAATFAAGVIIWMCGFVPIVDTFFLKLKEALEFKVIGAASHHPHTPLAHICW
eukprot:6487329-Prymnesium_polylepis.1